MQNILRNTNFLLKLQKFTWSTEQLSLYCSIWENYFRPYGPASVRPLLLKLFHCYSHRNTRVMDGLIRRQYIWPNLTRDVASNSYCRSCLACQTSKITRHNKPKPVHFDLPDARFQHVHIDLVGPLLPSYEPIITAEVVAREFYNQWISRYRAPSVITTDQGGTSVHSS